MCGEGVNKSKEDSVSLSISDGTPNPRCEPSMDLMTQTRCSWMDELDVSMRL